MRTQPIACAALLIVLCGGGVVGGQDCPPLEDADLTCFEKNGEFHLEWPELPKDCCEEIRIIEGATGALIDTLPGTASSYTIPCSSLPAPSGRLCIECVVSDRVIARACCSYECSEEPCPEVTAFCVFDLATNTIVASWPLFPAGCCDQFVIYDVSSPNSILMTLQPTVTGVSLPCTQLFLTTGKIKGDIGIDCVKDGARTQIGLCGYDCECPPGDAICVFDLATNSFAASWPPSLASCCQKFFIYDPDDPTTILKQEPAGSTGFVMSCTDIYALTGSTQGVLCIDCVEIDGSRTQIGCCSYNCDCENIPIDDVICTVEVGTDSIGITFPQVPDSCCTDFLIYDPDDPNTILTQAPGGSSGLILTCQEIFQFTGDVQGMLCVDCVALGGARKQIGCCSYDCSEQIAAGQVAGDCNQDTMVDLSDARCFLRHAFLGTVDLPCGDTTSTDPGNIRLMDWNGDSILNLADGIGLLRWKFVGRAPHILDPADTGRTCVPIPGCPNRCVP